MQWGDPLVVILVLGLPKSSYSGLQIEFRKVIGELNPFIELEPNFFSCEEEPTFLSIQVLVLLHIIQFPTGKYPK